MERDEAWKRVFDALPVAESLARDGIFHVTAEDLKAHGAREPRLMAKIDTLAERPAVLAEHGLALFPVRNGRYVLFPDPAQKSFFRFAQAAGGDGAAPSGGFDHGSGRGGAAAARGFRSAVDLESYDTYPHGEASESQALDFAFLSGLLPAFCGDDGMRLTLRGRLYSGDFRFHTPAGKPVDVSRVQIEVDAGYEGRAGIYLVEAKRGRRDDFHIRQLWYPFLNWSARSRKRVMPVFLAYSNGQYFLTEFAFGAGFGELETVRSRNYFLEDSPLADLDLRRMLQVTVTGVEPEGSFPQANDLDKIVDLAQAAAQRPLDKRGIAGIFGFDERQGDYYGSAAAYLGLLARAEGVFSATAEGAAFAALRSRAQRTAWLVEKMLRIPSLRAGLALLVDRGFRAEKIGTGELAAIIREHAPGPGGLGATTPERRASTLRAWLVWTAGNIRVRLA